MHANGTYEKWVIDTAARLKSDGCTVVSEIFHWCCLEHDIAYRLGLDPRALYVGRTKSIERREADARFRRCMQHRSKLGKASPIALVRWLGVRLGGWWGYNPQPQRVEEI